MPLTSPTIGHLLYAYRLTSLSGRISASERRNMTGFERRTHARATGPEPETSGRQRPNTIQHIKSVPRELLLIPSDPASPAVVDTICFTGPGIEGFFGKHCVLLDVIANE